MSELKRYDGDICLGGGETEDAPGTWLATSVYLASEVDALLAERDRREGELLREVELAKARHSDLAEQAVRPLQARVEELEDKRRSVMCAYCGEAFFEYPSNEPQDHDHAAALDAFARHDAGCSRNPLVAEIATLRQQVREVREAAEKHAAFLEEAGGSATERYFTREILAALPPLPKEVERE